MNLLDALPVIGDIVGKVVKDPNQAEELKIELQKLELQKEIARHGAVSAWLSNKSPFVAGAIPTILWMVSVVVLFNHIMAPLFTWMTGRAVPVLDLPAYYTDMATSIVYALFIKKAWDSTDVNIGGVRSPRKAEDAPPVVVQSVSSIPRDDPDYHDKRYRELMDRYGMEPGKEK